MRKILVGTAALTLSFAVASLASESLHVSPKAPEGVSSAAIRTKLESMEYRVDRIKADHDCWEVWALEEASAITIKANYEMTTGQLIRSKLH